MEVTAGHGREEPFECDQCGESFAQSTSMKDHMMIHEENIQYDCKQCGKSFHQYGKLKQHKQMHSGEKP